MRLVFMGSAELAIPSLQGILEEGKDEVVGVVSQPDRPAGRKRKLAPNPLKAFAQEQGLLLHLPEKIGEASSVEQLAAWKPDLFVVVAYGQYIPSRVIKLAPKEAINLHPSLLPKYRGAAPIQWALLNGDSITGASIITLAQKMDAGDILRQETLPILPDDTSATLHDKLAQFGASLLLKTLDDFRSGTVSRIPQKEEDAVEIRKLSKEDSPIDWSRSAQTIRNQIRALDPWPGTTCKLPSGETLKIWKATQEEGVGKPGELLDDRLLVATGDQALRLLEIQPPGKKRMPASAFLNGHPLQRGSFLG
jgi:methionyl-tRNA formyltransferase